MRSGSLLMNIIILSVVIRSFMSHCIPGASFEGGWGAVAPPPQGKRKKKKRKKKGKKEEQEEEIERKKEGNYE